MVAKLNPTSWATITLAAGVIGYAINQSFLQELTCSVDVPADSSLPWWIHTFLFVVFCLGQAAFWLPMALTVVLLRPEANRGQLLFCAIAIYSGLLLLQHFGLPRSDPYLKVPLTIAALSSFWIVLLLSILFWLAKRLHRD